jgi:hypothetical protein
MNDPLHIERTHAFDLPLPAHRALDLFTPLGEKAWVSGWEPVFLYPADGALREHAAFTTSSVAEPVPTIWLVTRFDPGLLTVCYARVTPGSRAGEVKVVVSPQSPASCKVTVSYFFTALSQAGNDYLASFTGEYFKAYISSWRDLIHAHLQSTPESPESRGAG